MDNRRSTVNEKGILFFSLLLIFRNIHSFVIIMTIFESVIHDRCVNKNINNFENSLCKKDILKIKLMF